MPSRATLRPSSNATAAKTRLLAAALVVLAGACNQASISRSDEGSGGSAGPSLPGGSGGRAGGGAGGGSGIALPDGGPAPGTPDAPVGSDSHSGGACQPTTCAPAGGRYCGRIGDGCGKILDCGSDCPNGTTCGGGGTKNLCGAPRDPNCKPIACQQMGGRLCGKVGDGCGGELDCGGCPGGETCGAKLANVCGEGPAGGAVCDNLCKQQVSCPAGQETTVTGTVFAPTPPRFGAADPLYNALVYVPNRPVQPFTAGVSCDLCGAAVSGAPIVTALSGPDGTFTLKNVPVGQNIPLVVQIGRWRRQVTIPSVTACTSTALPAELTRLPRNQKEGDIPQLAIATGVWDPFECVLRQIGIDESEFTPPTGTGRVHMYQYNGHGLKGAKLPAGDELVRDASTLARYDVVLLPCDDESTKFTPHQKNLQDYTARGGRLFMTDYSYSWLKDAGPFERSATWLDPVDSVGERFNTAVDQTFPKGQAFAKWLNVVGASRVLGTLPIHDPYGGASYFTGVVAPTQRWLSTDAPLKTVQHFTFNTPVGAAADKQCGRVVFSTFHVAEDESGGLPTAQAFPDTCPVKPMTPQEKALEFMLFDASACILPDAEPPRVFEPPPPAPPPPPPQIE